METDEHQDDATDQMDQMSAEESPQSSLKAGTSESIKQSAPIPHSTPHKGFRLSPIEFEDFDNESTLRDPEDEFMSSNKNGLNFGGEGEEEEFEVNPNASFLKDQSLTKSPTRNFKSSYAKSLADSYRRASLPVVVSAPKAQFYFKNEEFISLNARPFRTSDKFPSLNASVKTPSSGSFEPVSLPTILDVVPESQDVLQPTQGQKNLYNLLLKEQEDIFVPYEKLQRLCESEGSSFSLQDWHSLGSLITSDGRKLVKLSDFQERLQNQKSTKWIENGSGGSSRKDSTQVEGLRLERGQLEGRVEQLCETLADRDNTIQRLEEDLLRIRMECQRMIVENRSLRSSQGMSGAVANVESATQVARLEQQVQLLTAQLNRAERSRYTYEAATRQLVDFLHTVNSTLGTGTSANTSPTSSIHSANASPVPSPNVQTDDDDDPPYSPSQTTTNGSEMRARSVSHTFGPSRRGSNPIRRAGSVCTLPTQGGPKARVSRAVSTHCVASESVNPRPGSAVASGSQDKASPGRSHTSEYLATRAKELIASLKSLMRSESVLKLNLEPKKAGVASGSSTSRSTKSEGYSATDDHSRTTIWHVPPEFYLDNPPRDDNQNISEESHSGDTKGIMGGQEDRSKSGCSRISINGPTSTVLKGPTTQPVEVNGTVQPISLTVVGEASTPLDDRRFSSLPNRGRLPRTLNDSDHRLVWV